MTAAAVLIRPLLRHAGGAQGPASVPGTSAHCKCLHKCIVVKNESVRLRLGYRQLAEMRQAWRIPRGDRGGFRGHAGRDGRSSPRRGAHARDWEDERAGRYVFLVFMPRTVQGRKLIRPISARYMHKKEIDHYESSSSQKDATPSE